MDSKLNFKWTSQDGYTAVINDYVVTFADPYGGEIKDAELLGRLYAELMLVLRDMYALSVPEPTSDIIARKKILEAHMSTNSLLQRKMPSFLATGRPDPHNLDAQRKQTLDALYPKSQNKETKLVPSAESQETHSQKKVSYVAPSYCDKSILEDKNVKSELNINKFAVVTVGYDDRGNIMKNVINKDGRFMMKSHCYNCRILFSENAIIAQEAFYNADDKTTGFRYSFYPLYSGDAIVHCGTNKPSRINEKFWCLYDIYASALKIFNLKERTTLTTCHKDVVRVVESKPEKEGGFFRVINKDAVGVPGCLYNMMDKNGILVSDEWFKDIKRIGLGSSLRLICTTKDGRQTIIDPMSRTRIFNASKGEIAVMTPHSVDSGYVIFEREADKKRILVNSNSGIVTTRTTDGKKKWLTGLEYPDKFTERRVGFMFKVSDKSQWRTMDPKNGRRMKKNKK